MSSVRRCAALGCLNTSENCTYSMFKFPSDTDRSRIWIRACHREDLLAKIDKLHNLSYRICGEHFSEQMFANDSRTRLRKNVNPTIFASLQGSRDTVLPEIDDDNSLHEAETSSSFPDHVEGSISTDSTDHPLGGYDRKNNQWKPTFFKYKLQTEYPLNVKLVEGPSTSKNRSTTYVPEVDIPTKIEIDELPLNTDEIKREYSEDEEESFSSKRFCTEDEFTLLGKEVELKVRQMRTEYGRRLVMQKIQAILHEAEAGMYDYPDSSSQENVMPVFVDCSKEVVDVSCVKEEVDETGESYGDNFDANN